MISVHRKSIATIVGAIAAVSLAVWASPAALAAATIGTCSPTKLSYSASALDSETSSSTFSNIPQAAVSFVQGGSSPSCVIVRFSAATYGENSIDTIGIRAHLNNNAVALPASIRIRGETDVTGYPRSFEFIFPNVAPGNHVVRIQFRSEKGLPVHVKAYNTVVQFQ